MRPNMDAEIVVLQAVLANAKDEHQLKAGLAHAIELLEENVPYAAELAVCLRGMLVCAEDAQANGYDGATTRSNARIALAKYDARQSTPPASEESAAPTADAAGSIPDGKRGSTPPAASHQEALTVAFVAGMEAAAKLLDEEVHSADLMIEEHANRGDSHKKMRLWAIRDSMMAMAVTGRRAYQRSTEER
jgi:hypothetical protein